MLEHDTDYHPHEREIRAEKQLQEFSTQASSDPDYPLLHLAPPVGRLNDPNGLVYDKGTYHAFYQYSPLHPEKAVFWRHASSTDLTHWKDQQTAIAPVNWYDSHGCYSGSAVATSQGNLEFFYTGNVKNAKGERESYQCLFTSFDQGQSFHKAPTNPLLSGPEAGYTAHFRDPHVFYREDTWWMILGAQREDLSGAVVVYTSPDRRNWTFKGEISFSDAQLRNFSYMLECPIFLSLTDQVSGEINDILLFCPQGIDADGERFNNIYQCGYIVGHLRGLEFEVKTPFTELDAGFEFYAPQIFSQTPGIQPILMSWLGNAEEDSQPSLKHHWLHMMTYPREISLRNGVLYQAPVKELDAVLQPQEVALTQRQRVPGLQGARAFRLQTVLEASKSPVTITLEDTQGTVASLRIHPDRMVLDRSGSRYQQGGSRRRRSLEEANQHSLDILFDSSALEIFIDDGAVSFSSRIYLRGELQTVGFLAESDDLIEDSILSLAVARL